MGVTLFCLYRMTFDCVLGTCYETWSRCSRWSRWGTGRLWKNCNDRYKFLSSSHVEFKNFVDCPSRSISRKFFSLVLFPPFVKRPGA